MATMRPAAGAEGFRVVHPLHDAPEPKCKSDGLGPIATTPSVRLSLLAVRGYLILTSALLLWHVLEMAGVTHGH
jgi:hypothetical protein